MHLWSEFTSTFIKSGIKSSFVYAYFVYYMLWTTTLKKTLVYNDKYVFWFNTN